MRANLFAMHARRLGWGLTLCGCLLTTPVRAGELAYGGGYISEYSSNITRSATDERSEWINSLLAGVAYVENTPDLAARAVALAEYRNYYKDVYLDENVYSLDASAIWTISPRRFTWTVEDVYREVRRDVTLADVPTNRVGANVFSTGPDAYFQFGPVNTMALGGRYARLTFDNSNEDNHRYSASGRWLYQATSITTWSLNYEGLKVEFDDNLANVNFTREDTFLRYDTRPSRTRFTIDVGVTKIKRQRGDEVDGSLRRLIWTRQLTSESIMGLSLSSEYTDAGTVLLSTVTSASAPPVVGVPTGVGQEVVTADVFYAERGEVFYHREGSDIGVDVRFFSHDLDYVITPQDRTEKGGRAEVTLHHTGSFSSTLFGERMRTNFINIAREDTDDTLGLRFVSRLSRHTTLSLEGRHIVRASSDPSFDFTERRALLSLIYSSSPLFAPIIRR